MRPHLATVVLAFVAAACTTTDGRWVYSTTRTAWEAYGSPESTGRPIPTSRSDGWLWGGKEELAWFVGVLMVAPIAIDTVLLPITVPHDLVVS
jgi:hypothetical protein